MARILVSYYKVQEVPIGKVLCFWDGFVQELQAAGNDVFLINTAYFNPYNSNQVKSTALDSLLMERAKKFDPELIITFNHRIPKSFLAYFDVPIIIWDGDELSFFCDLNYIHDNISRYQIFTISKGWEQDYLDFGFDHHQISFVPQATAIKKMDIEQTMNVSFLGIRHFHNKRYFALIKTHRYSDQFGKIVKEFLNSDTYDYEALFKKHFSQKYPELDMSLRELYPLFDYRWLVLSNMLDLGLTISGHESRWEDAVEFMPQLVAVYNPQQVWTLEQNNWFYNASKVSLCPVTAQARGAAFSWRVFDIMASNACLLISQASDLKNLTKDYLDIPMYRTPWEARELCIKMLENEDYRLEIVKGSQRYVDENARWIHRFRDLEQIMGLKIIQPDVQGSVYDVILDDEEVRELIERKNYQNPVIAGKPVTPSFYQRCRNKFKNFCYRWSPMNKILDTVKLSSLLLILGMVLLIVEKTIYITIAGEIFTGFGCLGILFSAFLICINLLLKYRKSRWNK